MLEGKVGLCVGDTNFTFRTQKFSFETCLETSLFNVWLFWTLSVCIPPKSGVGSGLANASMLRCRGVCHMSVHSKPAQLCDGAGEGGKREESSRCAVRSVLMVH